MGTNIPTTMINRALIRLKVVQLVYAYYQNEGKTTEVALHDLYKSLLLLLVELRRMAERKAKARNTKLKRLTPGSDSVLAANQFLQQLDANIALHEWADKQ